LTGKLGGQRRGRLAEILVLESVSPGISERYGARLSVDQMGTLLCLRMAAAPGRLTKSCHWKRSSALFNCAFLPANRWQSRGLRLQLFSDSGAGKTTCKSSKHKHREIIDALAVSAPQPPY